MVIGCTHTAIHTKQEASYEAGRNLSEESTVHNASKALPQHDRQVVQDGPTLVSHGVRQSRVSQFRKRLNIHLHAGVHVCPSHYEFGALVILPNLPIFYDGFS